MTQRALLTVFVLLAGLAFLNGQSSDSTFYDFRDGVIITNGQSDDGSLKLIGNYSHHSGTYGLDMKSDAQIKIAVSGGSTIRFLGSKHSSLSMSGETSDGTVLDPEIQSTQVVNDLSDTYEFVYSGDADTLIFTATGAGSDVYLPLITVISSTVNYDFRDGTIITNGQSADGVVKLSGSYSHHSETYGLDMKSDAQIKIAVSGSCVVRFLGSKHSSLSMSGESKAGTVLDPAIQATEVTNDLSDTYEFAYNGVADTLIFTATGSGSDVYLPLIVVIPGDVKIKEWQAKSGSIIFNGDTIYITSGAAAGEAATVTLSEGMVIGATDETASVRMDLGGNPLSSFSPTATGSISSVTVSGDTLKAAFADSTFLPFSYNILVTDNSLIVEAEPGKTYSYNFANGSVLPQIDYNTLRYTSFVTQDGLLILDSNTDTESMQFGYHDASHGAVFFPGNSLDFIVAGNATITFATCQYGSATDAVFEFTDADGTVLGSIDATNIGENAAGTSSFAYSGPKGTITATLKSLDFPTSEIYSHGVTVENAAILESNGKIDVWDFGAEQLDTAMYNNWLNEEIINAWYDASIAVGSSGNVLPNFSAEGLSWTGGGNDRLRTSNTNLTRYDENLSSVSGYTGRVYVNSGANVSRYMSLSLGEDDEITLFALSQNGSGRLNFEYVADPVAQTDQVSLPGDLTELHFVAREEGVYHIFDDQDKPSYYRIYRKDADYASISGMADVSQAPGIPGDYVILFTNEAGKTWEASKTENDYTIDLPIGYSYEVSLANANGYIVLQGIALDVTAETTNHDISILRVELYTVSGAVTGLGSSIQNLELVYTPDPTANKNFVPEALVDTALGTYSVELEPNCEYTISALGVNDYTITNDKITIGAENTSADVVFAAKQTYAVNISAEGLSAEQLAKLGLIFTNLNEEGYVYQFSSIDNIMLRDGTYTIDYTGMDEFPLKLGLTSNLMVDGAAASKTLSFVPITMWSFDDKVIEDGSPAYNGLLFSGSAYNEINKGHLAAKPEATIKVPMGVGDKMIVTFYYSADFSIDGGEAFTTSSGSTNTLEYADYVYPGAEAGYATITIGSGAGTTYLTEISIGGLVEYNSEIHVGTDKEFQTINEALKAIRKMDRPEDQRVTVLIDPGNYEEMLLIDERNVSLKNSSGSPSIELTNKGVDIAAGAVRVTSYYGHGYDYYSMGSMQNWDADELRVNKENGYLSNENAGAGTTNGSYWNATVVVAANGFEADHIIFENSFNQYISKKESEDVIVLWESGNKGVRPVDIGNTEVQDRSFVERAAAIAITNNTDKVILNKCRVVGRQDSFFGGTPSRVVVYKGAMMGAVDYIFGGMTAVFYKTDLVMNTSDNSSDRTYITAAQQSGGRGYLMYECKVRSAVPDVESASINPSKPGYFGRPWQASTSEVVFFNTSIDTSAYPGFEGKSLIMPEGWMSSLGGESPFMYEYGTNELSEEDNSSSRASWSTLLAQPVLTDGTEITTFNFTKGSDGWDPIPDLIANDTPDFIGRINQEPEVKVFSYRNRVYVSDLESEIRLNVYKIDGALVKTVQAHGDTDFILNSGLYIINIMSDTGYKNVKLLITE